MSKHSVDTKKSKDGAWSKTYKKKGKATFFESTDEESNLSYVCTCEPICPLDCDPRRRRRWGKYDWDLWGEGGEGGKGMEFTGYGRWGLGECEGEGWGLGFGEGLFGEGGEGEESSEGFGYDLTTSGNILDRIIKDPRRHRKPFLCPWMSHVRFENMIPEDIKNDHQYYASIQKTILDQMCCLRVTSEPNCKRQPTIVATIGPACTTVEEIEELIKAGANMLRINMAYGDRCSHTNALQNIRTAANRNSARVGFHIPIAIIMDLKGPEIRTGKIHPVHAKDPTKAEILLKKDKLVKLTIDRAFTAKCTPKIIFVDYEPFTKIVRAEMKVYLDDGAIKLTVEEVGDLDCICKIEDDGFLGNYKQVHVPMIPIALPTITDQDEDDIEFAVSESVDCIAVSRVRNAASIKRAKKMMAEKVLLAKKPPEKPISILAKISNYEGLENIEEIIKAADGVIIQRGDLGIEIPPEKVFIAQREIIGNCNMVGKPVLCSTHLLKSMVHHPRPTRSEITDVAHCIVDGADGIILTAETAKGEYGVQCIQQAHHILRESEAATMQRPYFADLVDKLIPAIEPKVAIALSAVQVATKIRATAIIVITTSGKSAELVSWFRPRCIVIGISRFGRTARQMNLYRAIHPLHYTGPILSDWFQDVDKRFQYGITYGKEMCIIRSGDPLVLVSGYRKGAGFTNCLRIVYASIKPGVYIEHPKDYYDELIN